MVRNFKKQEAIANKRQNILNIGERMLSHEHITGPHFVNGY